MLWSQDVPHSASEEAELHHRSVELKTKPQAGTQGFAGVENENKLQLLSKCRIEKNWSKLNTGDQTSQIGNTAVRGWNGRAASPEYVTEVSDLAMVEI